MRRYVLRFLLVAIVFTVVNAKADPGFFSLSFNELQFGEDVLEYYNGGFGGAGSGPGPAFGVSFTPGLIAVEGDVYGDPDGKAAELDAPEVIIECRRRIKRPCPVLFIRRANRRGLLRRVGWSRQLGGNNGNNKQSGFWASERNSV
jgi:hypothetical protein